LILQSFHVGAEQLEVRPQEGYIVLSRKLLAKKAGMLVGQDLGLLHRHAGRRQAFDEGVGVENCRGHVCNVARAVFLSKQPGQ
jgi:hypothetical protein